MMHLKNQKRCPSKRNARRRLLHFEQCEQRLLLSVSPSGDTASEIGLFAGEVSENIAVRVRIETSDLRGEPITEAIVGEEFLVNVYVQDARENALGVFATYLDLLYDPDLVQAGDVVQFGHGFPHGRALGAATLGLLDEVGGFSADFTGSGSSEMHLVSMPFVANRPGQVDFVGEEPDYLASIPLVFGHDFGVPFNEVEFGRATLRVIASESSESSVSISEGEPSGGLAPSFQPVDRFQNAYERFGDTPELSSAYLSPTAFASTRSASPLASNGGFNDLDGLRFFNDIDNGTPLSDEFDSNVVLLAQARSEFAIDSVSRDIAVLSGNGTRLEPSAVVRRIAEDHLHLGDTALYVSGSLDFASSDAIRAFSPDELPAWNDTAMPTRPQPELDSPNISATGRAINATPLQVVEAAASDLTSTTPDAPVHQRVTHAVAFSEPTGNGGYTDLADLRQIAQPKPIDVPNVSAIQIAQSDNRPTPGGVARISNDARHVAFASLTWQLQVDGSRGVPLAFEMAEESQEVHAAQPKENWGDDTSSRNEEGRSALPSEDAASPDTSVRPPNAKTASFDFRGNAENVQDDRSHYVALSPLIVMVAGTLLVTDRWQKLQPREDKQKLP